MMMAWRRSAGVKAAVAVEFIRPGIGSIRALAFGALLACALATLTPQASGASTNPPNPFDRPVHALDVGDALPNAAYMDQDGKIVHIRDFHGRTLVIGFIYTNCADQCPILTNKFGALAAQLPASRFAFLEISIDPARDNRNAIAAFAHAHGIRAANWRVLTGPADLVETFAKPLGVSSVAGANGELLHAERTVIAGPDGRIGYLIDDAAWSPKQLAAAARHVDGLPSSALARLDLDLGKAVQAVCGGTAPGRSGLRDAVGVLLVFALTLVAGLVIYRRLFMTTS